MLGADDRYHLVYELELTNTTRSPALIQGVDIVDAVSDRVVQALRAGDIATRLVVRGDNPAPATLGPSQFGILYVHLTFRSKQEIPGHLVHRLIVSAEALGPTPHRETAGRVRVVPTAGLVLDPPLRGPRLIAGDGCCDSSRHIGATLPINGNLFTAQRFAIDWERLDDQRRIFD